MANQALMAEGREKREKIMVFLKDYLATNGYAPSFQEIADHIGISQPATTKHMQRLEKEGRLEVHGRRMIKLL